MKKNRKLFDACPMINAERQRREDTAKIENVLSECCN
jgi:hypothetical protein